MTDCEVVTLETTSIVSVCTKEMTEWEVDSSVRGYHVYKGIWTAAMGEQIGCIREPLNVMDRYAVALKKDGALISHLPKKCCEFVRCLSEVEEQLSVLSQA